MVECTGVNIPWGDKVVTVLLAYRPPRYPGGVADNGFSDKFCELLAGLRGQVVILGDFNYSGIDWSRLYASTPAERKVLDTIQEYFWSQYVDFPTHVGSASKAGGGEGRDGNILDLALSNSPELVVGVSDEGLFSDHRMLSMDLALPMSGATLELVPDWAKADFQKISNNLSEIDWVSELQGKSALASWEYVKEVIDRETEQCVPKKKRRKGTRPLWMTRNVMRLIRKKRRVWRWYTSSSYSRKDCEEFQAYKKVQDQVKKAVRLAKRNFERKLAKDAKKNPKAFYGYMKKKVSNRVSVGPLKDSTGQLVTDDQVMAEHLNQFFCSVFTQEDCSNIPEPENLFTGMGPLTDVEITEEKVKAKLQKLRPDSAPGPDRLWPRVLVSLADVLASPLALVYTKCLGEGTVPPDWKLANVAPIFKKGSKGSVGNYRPVSLTCVLCKVMESILRDAIVLHLDHHNLIRPSQHGFMARKSCLTNLLEYLEELSELVDSGHAVDIVYLDFAKAFDKVPHKRLLMKCKGLGIDGDVLAWISEWLRDRSQRVVLNGKESGWGKVISGVPQGSVLGPTLFIIFINDIDVAVEVTGALIKKFADDTKCYMVVESEEDRNKFQAMLNNLQGWSIEWQMLFNMDKCHVIHAGRQNPHYEYRWGEGLLGATEVEKDVGVMISSNLKPSVQCARAAKRANMVLGQLARGVSYRDKVTFVRLYQVFVLPHLSYSAPAWAPYSMADKETLEKVQRRAIMMVSNLKGSYEERLATLGLRSLEGRRLRGDLIETFKILTGQSDVNYQSWFKLTRDQVGQANTRANTGHLNLVHPIPATTEVRRNYFSHRVIRHWNQLPNHVKMCQNTNEFKNAYDRHTGYKN